MPKKLTLEGTLEELYEQYPELRGKRVRLTVLEDEAKLPVGSPELVFRTAELIHAQLRAAGYTPPTRETVDARVEAERCSWED